MVKDQPASAIHTTHTYIFMPKTIGNPSHIITGGS
jgi:hypothetical protein